MGLTSDAGRQDGEPVPGGDFRRRTRRSAATENVGALIGETMATSRKAVFIDLSDLPTKLAERRFMLAFLEALYHHTDAKKRDPYHLIVDEADRFAPQKPPKGDEVLLNRLEEIVRRGRVKGFIPWLITQRPAVLIRTARAAEAGAAQAHQCSRPHNWANGSRDRKIGARKASWLVAYHAARPRCRVHSGRGVLETVSFPEKKTFDSSRTPKRGERKRAHLHQAARSGRAEGKTRWRRSGNQD